MQIIETIGNQELLNKEKNLFLCSKRTPIKLYEHIFRWTESLCKKDCIACFNSTEMESEVLKALLVAKIPTILFVMNRFTDVNNIQIEKALKEKRLLIVILKRDEPKGKGITPRLRNEYVLSLCQHVICGYVNKNGSIYSLLAGRRNIEHIINETQLMVAEPLMRHERWTVAEDKVLLRMFYADMGIHAIHKRLQRSYISIYQRIRSITQPENLLKGREFEDYILGMFNIQKDSELVLEEWQSDKSLGEIHPENNSNPDFVFRYGKKEKFAIECKWRERLSFKVNTSTFPTKQIEKYLDFSAVRQIPVTIVLGIGGEPSAPNVLYIIPLEELQSIICHPNSIEDFRHTSESMNILQFIRQKTNFANINDLKL